MLQDSREAAEVQQTVVSNYIRNYRIETTERQNIIQKGFTLGRSINGSIIAGIYKVNLFLTGFRVRDQVSIAETIVANGRALLPFVSFKDDGTDIVGTLVNIERTSQRQAGSKQGQYNGKLGRCLNKRQRYIY